eukprot:Tbor_TRINITY_DN2388_c0_g1::TRINITY_DN2388_c0_g1_i1::g.109::m.109
MLKSVVQAIIGGDKAKVPVTSSIKNILPPSTATVPGRMPYHLSSVRWHTDIRQHTSILLLHDMGSNAKAWSSTDRWFSSLPLKGLSPKYPIQLYMPHIRNHGDGHHSQDSTTGDYLADVIQFADKVVEAQSPLHIIGHGFGGRLAMLTALAMPHRISSITVISHDDPFGPLQVPVDRLELLRKIDEQGKSNLSISQVNDKLTNTIKNEEERLSLLLNMTEVRLSRDANGVPKNTTMLDSNINEIINWNSKGTTWPTLEGSGSEDEIATALGKDTSKILCNIITSSPFTNKAQLDRYFPNNTIVSLASVPLNLGVLRSEDVDTVMRIAVKHELRE